MPDDNIDVVRRFWDATAITRDFEAAVELAQPDAEFDWSESRAPYAGVYRGEDENKAFMQTWFEAWDEWLPEITEAIDIDSQTVVIVTSIRARGKGSGVTVTAGGASLWRIRDGKIAYAKLFQSKEEALAAVNSPAT